MAKLKVYVVHDAKVGAYMQPFFCRSAGEAFRNWEAVINDGTSLPSKHPADFALFEVAEYDEETGRFEQYGVLKPLGTGLEAKRAPIEEAPMFSITKKDAEALKARSSS